MDEALVALSDVHLQNWVSRLEIDLEVATVCLAQFCKWQASWIYGLWGFMGI